MTTNKNTPTELDFVYESTLYRALSLGYTRRLAEDLAREAVKDHFTNG